MGCLLFFYEIPRQQYVGFSSNSINIRQLSSGQSSRLKILEMGRRQIFERQNTPEITHLLNLVM